MLLMILILIIYFSSVSLCLFVCAKTGNKLNTKLIENSKLDKEYYPYNPQKFSLYKNYDTNTIKNQSPPFRIYANSAFGDKKNRHT